MDLKLSMKTSTGVLLSQNGEILDKYGIDKSVLKTLRTMMLQDFENDSIQNDSNKPKSEESAEQ